MTSNQKTREQAERQWARDTVQMEKKVQKEWEVSTGDPSSRDSGPTG